MSALLYDLITIIRVLRRSRAWVPFDVRRYELQELAILVTEH